MIDNDNGIATTITTQKGVALQTNEQIRPLVKLRPYRTFQEVEQPESIFLIRVSDRGISFIEADGSRKSLKVPSTLFYKKKCPWQVSHTWQGQIGTMPNNFTPIIGVESENVNENHKNYDQKPVWHPGDYP